MDDDTDCVEHVWRLTAAFLGDGATATYECARCRAVTVVDFHTPAD